jgi:septal ring factor EnvC (AmiA/AmiB activator)
MTPAQQQAEIHRQAREMAAQQREAEREAARQRREQAAAERRVKTEQARTQREQARVVNSVVRGVFGVLTGRRRW